MLNAILRIKNLENSKNSKYENFFFKIQSFFSKFTLWFFCFPYFFSSKSVVLLAYITMAVEYFKISVNQLGFSKIPRIGNLPPSSFQKDPLRAPCS